jgi:hypothetical protein
MIPLWAVAVGTTAGVSRGVYPFGLLGHFQRYGVLREEKALISYVFFKKPFGVAAVR